jgi:hypothetical protein
MTKSKGIEVVKWQQVHEINLAATQSGWVADWLMLGQLRFGYNKL